MNIATNNLQVPTFTLHFNNICDFKIINGCRAQLSAFVISDLYDFWIKIKIINLLMWNKKESLHKMNSTIKT
jgi:hypothetical protein